MALQKKIVLEALRRVVMKTPVLIGRARGNWQSSIHTPAEDVLATVDPSGQETIAKGVAVLEQLPAYSIFWISNNLEYIEYLEAGSSQQAPAGMVSLTVAELSEMFN